MWRDARWARGYPPPPGRYSPLPQALPVPSPPCVTWIQRFVWLGWPLPPLPSHQSNVEHNLLEDREMGRLRGFELERVGKKICASVHSPAIPLPHCLNVVARLAASCHRSPQQYDNIDRLARLGSQTKGKRRVQTLLQLCILQTFRFYGYDSFRPQL